MKGFFSNLFKQGTQKGLGNATQKSRSWFSNKTKELVSNEEPKKSSRKNISKPTFRQSPTIGKMYMFSYDPKHKDTLPYYDVLPLVIPIDFKKDGFLGLNFHYLPYRHRAILLDALYDVISDERYDERTKLNVSYKLLAGVAKYKEFKPTLKRYLYSKMGSRFMEVKSSEWDIAIMLPLEKFKKASINKVWGDSLKKI